MRCLLFYVRSELCTISISPYSFITWQLISLRGSSNSSNSVVGMKTSYGLEVWDFEYRWGRVFHARPGQSPDQFFLLYNGSRGSLLGLRWPGREGWHSPQILLRLGNSRAKRLLPLCAYMVCYGKTFTCRSNIPLFFIVINRLSTVQFNNVPFSYHNQNYRKLRCEVLAGLILLLPSSEQKTQTAVSYETRNHTASHPKKQQTSSGLFIF
jgi:hypothetical protein